MDKLRIGDSISAQVIRNRMASDGLKLYGRWKVTKESGGILVHTDIGDNVVMNEGKKHILDVAFGGVTPTNPWYVALVDNLGTPSPPSPASSAALTYNAFFDTECDEFIAYNPSTRPAFVETVAAGPPPKVSNPTTDRAVFTFTGSGTVFGAVLVSRSGKNDHDPAGIIVSYRGFTSPIPVNITDVINVEIELSW